MLLHGGRRVHASWTVRLKSDVSGSTAIALVIIASGPARSIISRHLASDLVPDLGSQTLGARSCCFGKSRFRPVADIIWRLGSPKHQTRVRCAA